MKKGITSFTVYKTNITTDYNGIALFDPTILAACFGGVIKDGMNILEQATKTEMGDVISKHGAAIPVLGLDDNVYECIIRLDTEKSEVDDLIVIENGSFPLHVSSKLIIADMAVLVEWEKDLGWETVLLPLGYYAVTIRGFREIKNGEIIRFGFEFVLSPCDILPELTANLSMSMQILKL